MIVDGREALGEDVVAHDATDRGHDDLDELPDAVHAVVHVDATGEAVAHPLDERLEQAQQPLVHARQVIDGDGLDAAGERDRGDQRRQAGAVDGVARPIRQLPEWAPEPLAQRALAVVTRQMRRAPLVVRQRQRGRQAPEDSSRAGRSTHGERRIAGMRARREHGRLGKMGGQGPHAPRCDPRARRARHLNASRQRASGSPSGRPAPHSSPASA